MVKLALPGPVFRVTRTGSVSLSVLFGLNFTISFSVLLDIIKLHRQI